MRLFHRTSPDNARNIQRTQHFTSQEGDEACFTNRRNGEYSTGYGTSVVVVNVPSSVCALDDEFETGEKHYRVKLSEITAERIVRVDVR